MCAAIIWWHAAKAVRTSPLFLLSLLFLGADKVEVELPLNEAMRAAAQEVWQLSPHAGVVCACAQAMCTAVRPCDAGPLWGPG